LPSRITAVCASGVSTRSTFAKVARPRGWACLRRKIEKATSAEVKGLPSCQVTPSRKVKRYSRPSGEIAQAVASCGRGLSSSS
jgi:hypothetical protein